LALEPEVEGMDALTEWALDLHWSWNHAADELWKRPDAEQSVCELRECARVFSPQHSGA
jgi:hypothetical protein